MSISSRIGFLLGLAGVLWPRWAVPDVIVTQPYVGVTHIARTESTPRPVTMHILEIDLDAPGIQFRGAFNRCVKDSGGILLGRFRDSYPVDVLHSPIDLRSQVSGVQFAEVFLGDEQ